MKNKQGPTLFTRIIALFAVTLVPLVTAPVSLAATFYWDSDGNPAGNDTNTGAGLGGSGTWNTSSNLWFNGTSDVQWANSFANIAVFWGANQFLAGGVLGPVNTVNLGTNISAGTLIFDNLGAGSYVIQGPNTLTLGSPSLGVTPSIVLGGTANAYSGGTGVGAFTAYSPGVTVEIDSKISGTNGLAVYGGGTLILGNSSNDYTGFTVINNGTVVITNGGALGASTTTVAVNGTPTFGFQGGQLLVAGGVAPVTFNRNLAIQGRGDNNVGAALISVGNNTFNGNLLWASNVETRYASIGGNTTFNGIWTLAGGSGHVIYGVGNTIVNSLITNGAIANTGIIKTASGFASTIVLANPNNNFISNTRLDSGNLRVSNAGALGTPMTINQVSFNGGTLELRVDPANVAAFAGVYVSMPNASGTIYVNRDVGGTGLNQTITTNFTFAANRTLTMTGGDGYGLTLTNSSGSIGGAGGGNLVLTNNSNGLYNINASASLGDGTARTFTLNGNGDGIINGSIVSQGTADHNLTKSSNDTWTITGTNSSFTGGTFINGGTLAVRSIGNASSGGLNGQAGGVLSIGTGGTAGAFDYLGAAGTGAGESTTKTLNLAATTGTALVLADQAGSSPSALILAGNIGNTGAGAKTLYLGGNAPSSVVNEFHGVVSDNVVTVSSIFNTNLNKIGSSTWLYTPDASNYVTTLATAASSQATSANAVINQAVISVSNASTLAVGQVVSGTNVPAGSFIVTVDTINNKITINNNIATQINSGTVLTFTAIASNATTSAIAAANTNVITVGSTAGLVAGQVVTGVNIPNNSIVTQILGPTTFTISNNITTAVASSTTLSFGQISNFTGSVTISNGTLAIRPTAASGPGSDVINNSSSINFAADLLTANQTAGGTFEYQGLSTGSTETVGSLSSQAGGNTVKVTPGASGSTQLIFSGLGAVNPGSTLNFVTSGSGSIKLTGATDGFVDGHLFYNGSDFAYTTSGVVGAPVYGGADTNFSAPTSSGLTDFTHNEVTGSFTVVMNLSEYILSLKMVGNNTLTIASGSTLQIENVGLGSGGSGSAILQTGGAGVITGGDALSTAGGELVVRVDKSTDSLSIATPIDNSVFGLTKSGAGTLTLVGAHNYINGTTVNEGTLKLKNTTAGSFDFTLGQSFGAVSPNFLTVRQGAVLDLNGAGITALSAGTVVTSGTVVAGGVFNGAGTVTNGAAGTLTQLSVGGGVFSGVIQDGAGQVGLNKYGAGVLALTGTNTFTGPVTINDSGSLWVTSLGDIGVASGLGAGDATNAASNAGSLIFNNGTLKYTGSDNSQSGNGISIYQTTQSASVSTNRLFTIAGFFGGIDSSGTYGNDVLAAAATAGTANNAAVVFSNTADIQYGGTVGQKQLQLLGNSQGDNTMRLHLIDNGPDSLALLKGGTGLWELNPATANTYSGATEIDGGILRAQDGFGLSSNSALLLSGVITGGTPGVTNSAATGSGVLESSGTFVRDIGEAAGQVSWGGTGVGGFAASSAPLTVALGGVATPTQLVWANIDNPGASGMLILNSPTALSSVNFTNPIDLNSATATFFIDDNTSTTTDFAILSGVISGTGGSSQLVKVGNGLVYITGANTYQGSTFLNSGTVAITSFGSSTNPTSSSIGAYSAGASLNLGNGGTGVYLLYLGNGEVTDRLINIASTTGQNQIESSGGGPLVLQNVAITGAGAKTLVLRGFNTDNNTITSNLGNNGGNFAINKSDSGTWILSGDNTYAGGTTLASGFLGVTATHATGSSLGTGTINFSNGGIFALDGAVTFANPVGIVANTTALFTGNYSQTYNGTVTGASGNPWTINNTITNGGILTFSSTANFVNADTGTNRALTFAGTGNTVYNGVIQNPTAGTAVTNVVMGMATTGSLTLGNTASTFSNGFTLTQGTLILGAAAVAGDSATSGRLGTTGATNILNFNGGAIQGTVALTGTNKIANPTILNGNFVTLSGANAIEFGGNFTVNAAGRLLDVENTGGLTLSGNVFLSESNAAARGLTIYGSKDVTITGPVASATTVGTLGSALTYSGTGTLTMSNTINLNGTTTSATLTANSGTMVLNGAGKLSAVAAGVTVNPTAILRFDNSGTNTSNRLSNTIFNLQGGTFDYIANGGGSTETSTAVLNISSTEGYITTSGGTSTLTFGSLALVNTGSVLVLDTSKINALGSNTKILFSPTAPTLSNNIISRVLVTNGSTSADFATYNGTNGLIAFTGYTATTNIDTAATTATLDITGNATANVSKTINAFRINGNGITVGGSAYLTLTSGGVLVNGGSNTLSVAQIALGGTIGELAVNSGASLNMSGALFGTGGWVKSLGGTVTLSAKQFVSSTNNLSNGTIVLNAGLNTLYQNQQFNMGQANTVLDLNGNTQFLGILSTTGTLPNEGGTITSNTGTGILMVNETGSSTFAGHLNDGASGTLSFVRSSGNTTLTFESSSNFSGPALLLGGTNTFQDSAAWTNVASIDVNYAVFQIGNNSGLQFDVPNRINDAAPITLRGGQINWTGRAMTTSTETMGSLTLAEGSNGVLVQSGNSGTYFSGDLTFASLIRPANSGATINITTNNTLGSENNNARLFFTAPPTLQQSNAIGAWAIANTQDYATYNTTQGVGAIGGPGFQPYDIDFGNHHITNLLSTNTNLSTNLTAASTSTGLLRLSGIFNSDITFSSASNILNLQEGGILHANTSSWSTFGTTATRGFVTAGGTNPSGNTELVVYNNNGTSNTLTGQTLSLTTPNATVAGSSVLNVTSIGSIAVGNVVVLAGVLSPGTVVTAVDPVNLQVTLSQPALTTTNAGSFVFSTNLSQSFTGAATNSTVLGSTTLTMTAFGQAVQPGMIVTGPNIPVGTTVVAVNTSLNTVTLSQAATLTANAGTFAFLATDNVNGSVVINSVIEDTHVATGSGTGTVSLVKSGLGTMVLTAPNTYTGGTIVDQGTLYLKGDPGVVVIPFSPNGLVINGSVQNNTDLVQEVANPGQIDPANTVTFNGGGGTLTLVGNNTLAALVFNNDGNNTASTVNTAGTLTLTSSTPITATSINVGSVPIINGTLQFTNGVNTLNIGGIKPLGQLVTTASPTLNIAAAIIGSGSILKTNDGILQLTSTLSTFTGGIHVTGGGLMFANNSTPTSSGFGVQSGPFGTGTVTMDGGTSLLIDTTHIIANAIVFNGDPIFNTTSNSSVTMTLNGSITLTPVAGVVNISIPNAFLTVLMNAKVTNAASIVTINKTGLGILGLDVDGMTSTDINAGTGPLILRADGNGFGTREVLALGDITFDGGAAPVITVDRAASTAPFTAALNKLFAPASLTSIANGITLNNNNGYGLRVSDNVALNPNITISVATGTNSNVVQGLYLTGILSGGGAGSVITKIGSGTLELDNPNNSFLSTITITGGILAAASDGALGNPANVVNLSVNAATGAGFRATGTFATSRAFNLTQANNAFEVSQTTALDTTAAAYPSLVNTLTINSALNFTAAANALVKNDAGVLVLTTAPTVTGGGSWTGAITLNQGALRITNGAALGSTSGITIATLSTALELANATVARPITITPLLNNITNGINSTGAIRAVSGANTVSSLITLPSVAFTAANQSENVGIAGVAAGATLNLSGGITFAYDPLAFTGTSYNLYLYSETGGSGTLSSVITQTGNLTTGNVSTLRFYGTGGGGAGTWTINVANAFLGRNDAKTNAAVLVNSGTLVLTGAGSFTASATAGSIDVNPGASLVLNNLATPTSNPFNDRNLRLFGAGFTYNGLAGQNSSLTWTSGLTTFGEGLDTYAVNAGAGGSATINLGSTVTARSTGGVVLFTGTNLGTSGTVAPNLSIITASAAAGGLTFRSQTGATNTANKGIVPWAFIDTGSTISFVTSDSAAAATTTGTNYLRPLNASEAVTSLIVNDNVDLSSTPTITASLSINSLKLENGASVTINGTQGFTQATSLTIQSGGLIAMGNNTISGGLLIASGGDLVAYTQGNLEIDSAILATSGLSKAGAGTLTLGGKYYGGLVTVSQGTLKLAAGNDTLFQNVDLILSPGGVLDLNGTNFFANRLRVQGSDTTFDPGSLGNSGVVTNTSATLAILSLANANVSYDGNIQGNLALVRSQVTGGFQDWNLRSPMTYTGPTLLTGGRTQLLDDATMSNTSSIDINHASLLIQNQGSSDNFNLLNRVNDNAPITLNGGMLQFRGRNGMASSETVGDVTIATGTNEIDIGAGTTNVNSTVFTMKSLTQVAGSHATLRFQSESSTISGDQALVVITNAPNLTNNIIGGWAINSREFATYAPDIGVGSLNGAGYATYSLNTINTAVPTDNIRVANVTANTTVTLTGDRTMYTLNTSVGTTANISEIIDLGGFKLTVVSGGIIAGINNDNENITYQNGTITAGTPGVGGDLYLHAASYGGINRTVTINANIADNGVGGTVALVIDGDLATVGQVINTVTLSGNNSYSGGTFLNSGILLLAAAGANGTSVTAIPGDLTVTGGFAINTNAFNQTAQSIVRWTSSNQIKNTANVTLYGGSTLDLNGFNQTINNLTIKNDGGNLANFVTIGTGTFTLTGNVTVTSSDSGLVPQINATGAGSMVLTPGQHTFDIDSIRFQSATPSAANGVGSSRVDLQACKLEYSIVSPK